MNQQRNCHSVRQTWVQIFVPPLIWIYGHSTEALTICFLNDNWAYARIQERHPGLLHEYQGPKHLSHLHWLSQVHQQGIRLEVEQSELGLVLKWDASAMGGGLICYPKIPASVTSFNDNHLKNLGVWCSYGTGGLTIHESMSLFSESLQSTGNNYPNRQSHHTMISACIYKTVCQRYR